MKCLHLFQWIHLWWKNLAQQKLWAKRFCRECQRIISSHRSRWLTFSWTLKARWTLYEWVKKLLGFCHCNSPRAFILIYYWVREINMITCRPESQEIMNKQKLHNKRRTDLIKDWQRKSRRECLWMWICLICKKVQ